MKSVLIFIVLGIIALIGFFSYDPPTKFYTHSGLLSKQMKVFVDTATITAATQSFDISPAGFTQVAAISVQPELNTTNASNMPLADIKSYTTSAVTINFIQSNSTTIGILGINVLGLQSLQSFANTRVHIVILGY